MASAQRAVSSAFVLQKARCLHTKTENAQYSLALIRGLKGMAIESHQFRLAHLLELAELEAKWLQTNSS